MPEKQPAPSSPDLFISNEACVEASIGERQVPLFLAERTYTDKSRTKAITMNWLVLQDEDKNVRVRLFPASGTMKAVPLAGAALFLDRNAVETLQHTPIDPLTSPIPRIKLTDDGGYEQDVVPSGHSLDGLSLDTLRQQLNLNTALRRLSTPQDPPLLSDGMIAYQLLRLMRNDLRAVETIHDRGLTHGDIGQRKNLANALNTYQGNQAFLIDYSYLTRVLPGNEHLFDYENRSLTGRMKEFLAQYGLDTLMRNVLGANYDAEVWNAMLMRIHADNLLSELAQRGEFQHLPQHIRPQEYIQDQYTRALIYKKATEQNVGILAGPTEGVLDCIKEYYATQAQTLGIFRPQHPTS